MNGEAKGLSMNGILGRPDPVAWRCMTDVMLAKIRHNQVSQALITARGNGQVGASLALCQEQMRIEGEVRQAHETCKRLAGEACAEAALWAV